MDPSIVKKNSNEFSAAKEVLAEVNNTEFKSGALDFYASIEDPAHYPYDTSKSYVWSAISAIADNVSEELYEKVLNFIDDVSDVDTCSVKSLQSMVQLLGTDFSLFKTISRCPLEILKLIDVFSMRKDYLLNDTKVCRQLADYMSLCATASVDVQADNILSAVNQYRSTADLSSQFPQLSCADRMLSTLDAVISSTYYDVLADGISGKYTTVPAAYVFQELSTSILCAGFDIPNKYTNDIDTAKVRLNISPEFDPSDELDLIDHGISAFDSYSPAKQEVLSIELKRRSEAKNALQPSSRYAYYQEAHVRDYFKFIENEWNSISSTYLSSSTYEVNKSYLEVSQLSGFVSLASANADGEITLNMQMVHDIAKLLLDITGQIRDIREHLKSHAQRTYMKGTWLLLAYAINEFLKDNIYPTLNKMLPDSNQLAPFDSSSTKMQLKEYVDQTLYSNIHTDIIEDKDDSTLNPEFWKGTGADGTLDQLDTTDIFMPESKSMLVTQSTFSQDQIRDFYFNTLETFKALDLSAEAAKNNSKLYSFLSCVFSTGADNSWLDSDRKVMCELQNTTKAATVEEYEAGRRFTIDIDKYLKDLSAAYLSSHFVLSSYQPIDNLTIHTQLDDALAEFKERANDTFSSTIESVEAAALSKIAEIKAVRASLDSYYREFNNLIQSYSNLTATNLAYTGDFIPSSSKHFINQLNQYELSVERGFGLESRALKNDLISQLEQMRILHDMQLRQLKMYKDVTAILTDVELTSIAESYDPLSLSLGIDYHISALSADSLVGSRYDSGPYELLHDTIETVLLSSEANSTASLVEIISFANRHVQSALSTYQSASYDQLSALLSSCYDDQFSIHSCVEEVSARVDYSQTSWYKYKQQLFQKYGGNSICDQPYYQLENSKHPSYQIHPCLSNFIEKLDFSAPLENLAGIAADAISSIATASAKSKLSKLCIDLDGYLLSAWCNPLNGNTDYLSRYEKADHVDARGRQNPLFGYDGPFYPQALAEIEQAGNSLSSYEAIETSWFAGLNISDIERAHQSDKVHQLSALAIAVAHDPDTKIIRYGLDTYGNSYTVISAAATNGPTLWVKPKNYPYSFPAFIFNNSTLDETLSWVETIDGSSNTMMQNVDRCNLSGTSFQSIVTDDFTFAQDQTVLLLNCRKDCCKLPVHCIVHQQYVIDDTHDEYVRHFLQDPVSRQEHLISTDFDFGSFYYDGHRVGDVFLSVSNSQLSILVDSYLKNEDTTYIETSAMLTAECNPRGKVKVDCQPNGIFSIAYVEDEQLTSLPVQNFSGAEFDYIRDDSCLSCSDARHSYKIITQDFQLYSSMLCAIEGSRREHLPYSEMGFVALHENKPATLSGTSLQDDLDAGKPLKFELYGTSADIDSGIDFKFLVPMRVYDGFTTLSSDQSYHRDGTEQIPCYRFDDLHYLESAYSQWLLDADNPTYWDLTETERKLYPNDVSAYQDRDITQRLFDYSDFLKYAKHDVQQHLSALIDEEYGSTDEYALVAEPYVVPMSYDEKDAADVLATYFAGHYDGSRTISLGNYRFRLDESEISVSWMANDVGTIKLDFNAYYYADANSHDNERNKNHCFLNLDQPGDAGILKTYAGIGHSQCMYMLFIKNISDKQHPRFVMKKIDLDEHLSHSPIAAVVAAKQKNSAQKTQLLKLNGFETRFLKLS